MSFVTPLFLLGLLAIAVPVLIHLSRRRTQEVVAFPSLMFLSRVPYKSLRRRRLRDLLLLAMRCLALAALALAFARPLLQQRATQLGGERRDVVVLLDRSFSMGFGDRWSSALADARGLIDGLAANDSLTLIAFDETAEVVAPPSGDAGILRSALEELAPGSKTTHYAPALRLARAQLIESRAPVRSVVLIGDLQRGGLGESLDELRLPPGTGLELLDVTRAESDPALNYALADVTIDRSPAAGGGAREMVSVGARLLRLGVADAAAPSATVQLELNGRVVAEQTMAPTTTGSTMAFDPVELESGLVTRGRVLLAESLDRLAADDELRFTITPEDAVPVLVLDGGAADRRRTVYLERALATGRAPRFEVRRRSARDGKPADLEGASVVVVLDAGALLSDELRSAIDRFVDSGGGLLLTVGRRASGGWRSLELPGEEPVAQELVGRSLAYVEYEHPVFARFSAMRYGDFSSARFFRFRRLPEVGDVTVGEAAGQGGGEGPAGADSRALVRFDDGSPALVEIVRGAGRTLVWASTFDNLWGDLVVQPVFVPFVDSVVRYLSGHQPAREAYRVGQIASLELPEASEGEWLVSLPSGSKTTRTAQGELLLPLDERGFYDVRPVQGSDSEGLVVAANVDPRESDLGTLDAEELELALRAPQVEGPAATDEPLSGGDPERDHTWWFVLLAVLLLLAGESLFSNRRRGVRGSPVEAAGS